MAFPCGCALDELPGAPGSCLCPVAEPLGRGLDQTMNDFMAGADRRATPHEMGALLDRWPRAQREAWGHFVPQGGDPWGVPRDRQDRWLTFMGACVDKVGYLTALGEILCYQEETARDICDAFGIAL